MNDAENFNLICIEINITMIQGSFDLKPEQAYAAESSGGPNPRYIQSSFDKN